MIIRKQFKFENAHIVRNCTSKRCSHNIHGHSYIIEVFFEAFKLDNASMVYDFGLTKGVMKEMIESFDHATSFWEADDEEYIGFIKQFSQRWIQMPINPSAEGISLVLFKIIDAVLTQSIMQNNEEVTLRSVRVHETATGYAECFREDANIMGKFELKSLYFSSQIESEWGDSEQWKKILNNEPIINPKPQKQILL